MKVNLPYMDGMGHNKRIISTTLLIMVWTLQKGQVWLCFSQGSELDLQTTSDLRSHVLRVDTLPETNSLHLQMDGWKDEFFPFGAKPIFRCKLLVFGSVVFWTRKMAYINGHTRNHHGILRNTG